VTEAVSLPLEEVILAEEAERGRISRQLAEGPAQALSNVLMEVEICEQLLARRPEQLGDGLNSLRATASRALLDVRRMLYELRPAVLDEIGVTASLRRYLTELARLYGIEVDVTGPDRDDLPKAAQLAVYRMLQELAGVAAADDRVRRLAIDLRYEPAQVVARVEVQGSGVGQRPRLAESSVDEGFRARLDRLGGSLAIEAAGDDVSRATVLIPLA
jgi:two-component system sensor histidine kinase DegS